MLFNSFTQSTNPLGILTDFFGDSIFARIPPLGDHRFGILTRIGHFLDPDPILATLANKLAFLLILFTGASLLTRSGRF